MLLEVEDAKRQEQLKIEEQKRQKDGIFWLDFFSLVLESDKQKLELQKQAELAEKKQQGWLMNYKLNHCV